MKLLTTGFLLFSTSAFAGWYDQQVLTPETKQRLGVQWNSCCLGTEVVKTRFRAGNTDEWYYLNGDKWVQVPPDTIHWDQHAPDGQATLFVYAMTGVVTCFFPPEGGI